MNQNTDTDYLSDKLRKVIHVVLKANEVSDGEMPMQIYVHMIDVTTKGDKGKRFMLGSVDVEYWKKSTDTLIWHWLQDEVKMTPLMQAYFVGVVAGRGTVENLIGRLNVLRDVESARELVSDIESELRRTGYLK